MRTDPILTSDVDPNTSCYVRFYHEKFQKDRPDLLHQIKRATKSEQQSKDDVDSLKGEVTRLKDCITTMSAEMDRKLAEMSYEYNRRITTLSAEYDKLATLVTQLLGDSSNGASKVGLPASAFPSLESGRVASNAVAASHRVPDSLMMQSLSQVAAMSLQHRLRAVPPVPSGGSGTAAPPPTPTGSDPTTSDVPASGSKRAASEANEGDSVATKARIG